MGAEAIGPAAAVVSLVAWALKRRAEKDDAQAPDRHQNEVDHELASPDKRKFAARLSRLFDRSRHRTDPDIVLIPNDRFLEPVYGQDGRMIRGRSSIADGYLREIEQRLTFDEKEAKPCR